MEKCRYSVGWFSFTVWSSSPERSREKLVVHDLKDLPPYLLSPPISVPSSIPFWQETETVEIRQTCLSARCVGADSLRFDDVGLSWDFKLEEWL